MTITAPVVTVSPTSLTTTRNTPFTLTASSNYPGATFQWTSNDTGQTYAAGATLTTSVPGPQSSYTFTVTATAGACSASNSVVVTLSNPLPVQLAAFSARRQGSIALLSWNTASEHNNAYFAVERSTDGSAFVKLAQVTGAGESSTPRAYAFTDQRPQASITYYRLQQVDHNGQAAYSPVVALPSEQAAGDWLVRSASPRHFTVQGPVDDNSRFVVLDMLGRPIFTQALSPARTAVGLPNLPTGVYFFTLITEQGRFTVRQFLTGIN
ncbi:T9SS type A sorting domain-containing protein [Hymenobacter sedentarius]|uniref:T9SS type A sorting domain-containing protein n=1 Tax=Hymenobacter sedentarius TaxID=1411621 RepID=UPI0012FE3C43|nr:T9SS type A sorting domain-containing protein [Hymenobacter sedentarius]